MKYILNNRIVDFGKDISKTIELGKELSDNWSKPVQLTSEMEQFLSNNPNALVSEIWNCKLNDPIVMAVVTPAKQREQAYANEPIIEWNGELLTCDNARLNHMSAYFYSDQTEKFEALKALWLQARTEIQTKYPD